MYIIMISKKLCDLTHRLYLFIMGSSPSPPSAMRSGDKADVVVGGANRIDGAKAVHVSMATPTATATEATTAVTKRIV